MSYILGIDGGGTKTRAILSDHHGTIYADTVSGPSNFNSMSEKELYQTFKSLFLDLDAQANQPFSHTKETFIGLAGGSNETNKQTINAIVQSFMPQGTLIQIVTDAVNALYSGTYGEPGIVQIAGTGSIAYGVNTKGQSARAGGWGYLLGDEGSGYSIGKLGIAASLRSYDGKDKKTSLYQNVFDYFQVETGEKLIEYIYNRDSPKNIIAATAKLVFDAYKENDPTAESIIEQAGREINENILTLHNKLFKGYQGTKVVLCGGIFQNSTMMPRLVEERMRQQPENIQVVLPDIPPVAGSLIGALRMDRVDITEECIGNLRTYFKSQQGS